MSGLAVLSEGFAVVGVYSADIAIDAGDLRVIPIRARRMRIVEVDEGEKLDATMRVQPTQEVLGDSLSRPPQ